MIRLSVYELPIACKEKSIPKTLFEIHNEIENHGITVVQVTQSVEDR